jgi:hypothetical protein
VRALAGGSTPSQNRLHAAAGPRGAGGAV